VIWLPPLWQFGNLAPWGSPKTNFDVAIRKSHSMAAASCRDHSGKILFVWMKILPSADPPFGEPSVALLGLLEAHFLRLERSQWRGTHF
jgi:hypothetical protein